jgi:hypothetical protein
MARVLNFRPLLHFLKIFGIYICIRHLFGQCEELRLQSICDYLFLNCVSNEVSLGVNRGLGPDTDSIQQGVSLRIYFEGNRAANWRSAPLSSFKVAFYVMLFDVDVYVEVSF